MNIFDPSISGSLSVSGSGQISGDLHVLGTLYATVSGTTQNAVSASHAAAYTLTSSFHQFTSSYTTGSFTGSFIGNGAALYNIPASGVTGLNLSQISDGSVTASLSQANGLSINTNTEITGNLTVTGRLTAQEYHTELVSASIIYESGSTKFGDSLDDVHAITGSVDISGSLEVNNLSIGGDRLVNVSVTDAGGKYYIDNVRNPILTLIKGYTYKFLFPNIGAHPFRFSTTNDGTHNGGVAYTTGVTTGATPDYIQIEVTDATPSTLYYFCTSHVGMGNSISVLSDILNLDADRNVVYIEPSRIATTGSNAFTGSQLVSGSLSVTGSVDITGSITLNGQPIGTGKLDETVFNSYTSSNNSRVSSIETSTGSLNSFTGSIDTTIKTKMNNDGVISGSVQVDITSTTGYSTFSSSLATTDSNQESRLGSIETSTGSLNTFSSSANGRLNSLETASGSIRVDFNSYTSSNDSTNSTQNSRLTNLETSTGSINTFTSSASGRLSSIETSTSSINTFTSSAASNISSLETASGSIRTDFNSYTSSNNSTNSTQNSRLTAIETATSSLNSFTSSIDSTIKTKLNTEGVISGSVQVNITSTTGYSTFSSSIATTDSNQDSRLNSLEGKTGSYATTGSNVFQGNQTITGSLYISQDLIVVGSSSIQNISSSIVNIADNIITVNALNPSIRFGGLAVIDSGSSPQVSGSMLFDSVNNQWIFVHQNQSSVTSSVLLMGPETYNNLGGEGYLTQNRIPKGSGIEHLYDSNIIDTGTKVSINSNTEVTGTLAVTQNISSPNITAIQTATGSLNSFTSSVLAAIELTGSNLTVKGNLLVKGTTTNVNTTTLDVDNNLINLNGTGATSAGLRVKDTTGPNQVSGSLLWDATNDYWIAGALGSEQRIVRETEFNNAVTRIGNIETSTGSLNSFTSSINTTIKSKLNSEGVISGSSQVSFNGITDKPTLVSGSSQISFNTISDKPTLVSGSSQISYSSISGIPSGIVSGSSQISFGSISGIPSGLVSGSSQITGISNSQLTNSSFFVGTTSISLGRASASQTLTGVSVDGNAGTVTNGVYTTGDQSIAGVKTFTGTISVTANEGREITTYMPSSYTTNDLVSGHEYGWYDDHWRLGMTRSSGAAGADFVIQWNAARRLSLTSGGNLSVTGTINGLTVSGGTITTGTWNGSSISTTYTAAKVTAVNAGTGISVDTTTGSVTVTNTGTLTVAGTSNQVLVNGGTAAANGNITLSLPQSINTGASPTFAGLTVNGSATTAIFRNVTNTSNSNVQMGNDSTTNGAGIALLGSAFSASGQYRANGGYIYSNLSGGLTLHAEGNNSMYLATNGSTAITINSSQVATFANTINGSINGTITKTISSGNHENFLYANVGSDDYVRIRTGADAYNSGYIEIATADDGTEPIYVRQYNGVFSSIARTATLLDGSGNTSFPGTITAYSGRRVAMSNSTTFSNVSSVSFTHNLGTENLTAQVFDSSNNMFFPSEINITSTTVTVTFAANRTGRLVVTG